MNLKVSDLKNEAARKLPGESSDPACVDLDNGEVDNWGDGCDKYIN